MGRRNPKWEDVKSRGRAGEKHLGRGKMKRLSLCHESDLWHSRSTVMSSCCNGSGCASLPRQLSKIHQSSWRYYRGAMSLVPFGVTYEKIGTIQRRLAWPLHKDDTLSRSGRPTGLNIYFASSIDHRKLCISTNGSSSPIYFTSSGLQ